MRGIWSKHFGPQVGGPDFDCAVCGKPCRWIDRDKNHEHAWGFYCDRCAVFSEHDVELED